jgi:hypothetical protein
MRNKSLLVLLLTFLIVVAIVISSTDFITIQSDYGTGLNIDTDTQYFPKTRTYDPHKGKLMVGEPLSTVGGAEIRREMLYKDKYVVSWMPGEYSELITLRTDFEYYAQIGDILWGWLGRYDSNFLGAYYYVMHYVSPSGDETKILDMKYGVDSTHLWDDDYISMVTERWPEDQAQIAGRGYKLPNKEYKNIPSDDTYKNIKPMKKACWLPLGSKKQTMQTDTIEFHMKGMLVGALKVELHVDLGQVDDSPWIGYNYYLTTGYKVAEDACYLASGAGDINILGVGAKEPADELERETNEMTSGQVSLGDFYLPYVFEEESTVKIEVDTGYSGSSLYQGEEGYGEPWELAIYDGEGVQRKSYTLQDNLRGKVISYPIPTGAFVKGGNNEWRVVLRNHLFDQAQTRIFVIDDYEKAPSSVTVNFDQSRYEEFDDVYVTMEATANPEGAGDIAYFVVIAKYGTAGSIDLILHKQISAIKTGDVYKAAITISLPTRPTTKSNLYVRVHAVDSDGRASGGVEKNAYVAKKSVSPIPDPTPTPTPLPDVLLTYALIAILIILLVIGGLIIYKKRGGDFSSIKNAFKRGPKKK